MERKAFLKSCRKQGAIKLQKTTPPLKKEEETSSLAEKFKHSFFALAQKTERRRKARSDLPPFK